jgi:ATP-dependent NAD(P)H-hydrate dehydratase
MCFFASHMITSRLVNKMVDRVVSGMDRLHVLVIGPGLGRCPLVLKATTKIIKAAMERDLPIILDADGLFLLTLPENETLLKGYNRVVLTPNVVERKRLNPLIEADTAPLSQAVIVEKGAQDSISLGGTQPFYECAEEGGLKRSGGLGDILSGTMGTLVAWNAIMQKDDDSSTVEDLPLACWTACCFTKRATRHAYEEHKRSMTAPDVLSALGSTINEMTG